MQVFIFFYDLIVFLERRFTFFYFFSSKKCTRGIYGLSCRSCPTLTVSLGWQRGWSWRHQLSSVLQENCEKPKKMKWGMVTIKMAFQSQIKTKITCKYVREEQQNNILYILLFLILSRKVKPSKHLFSTLFFSKFA
jgi:hypothetical protein